MADRRKLGASHKALLHVAKAQLGLDEDTYRDLLRSEAGVESSRDLTPAGFDKVMRRFRALGFRRRRAFRPNHDAEATITRAQQAKIDELYSELGWDINKRNKFSRRQTGGKPWPQTRRDANKVIEGLKAILAREAQATKGGSGKDERGVNRPVVERDDAGRAARGL